MQRSPVLYWFRNDLRLHDNPAWTRACALGRPVVAIVIAPSLGAREMAWGIAQVGAARHAWWWANVQALGQALGALGVPLHVVQADPCTLLPDWCQVWGTRTVVCEDIAAPYEQAQVAALRAAGLVVHSMWQSTLMAADQLPYAITDLPPVFTRFRNDVERAGVPAHTPLPAPTPLPGLAWATAPVGASDVVSRWDASPAWQPDPRSAFQWKACAVGGPDTDGTLDEVRAGSRGGQEYLRRYLASERVARYKATRNGLLGMAYSSKWSPYLAWGALSAPELLAGVRAHEAHHGVSDGSYWLWFELLWRDYFRWLHRQWGLRLYRACGLRQDPVPRLAPHNHRAFALWTQGRTGCELVDAGMRELAHSGYLSNRMRQVVASFWVHELGGDWRAGAAWFEAQLLDFDVYSNQGNWLYIAGRGTDPRGGRRFDVAKQTAVHDPDGAYRALWSAVA
ncbi:MAG: DASH family cryptochrome [Rhodoferax sp.]|nr:DASH family cryptochrome [Rhodoferax sp.]